MSLAGATVAEFLHSARASGVPRSEALRLASHHLGQPREWLLAHDEEVLAAPMQARLQADLARRAAGVPLAYLVGEREFHGLTLAVSPAVLVPRPDTEVLVDWALELASALPAGSAANAVDLGTGSGAIALAFKAAQPAWEVTATDLSSAALAVAASNAQRLDLPLTLRPGAWWQAVAGQQFALALSNPPYVAAGDPHLGALVHEPAGALTPPDGDGLSDLRAIVRGAPAHLRPGAWLLLEHGYDQAAALRALLQAAGFAAVSTRHDLGGQPRCTGGQWLR